MIRGWVLKEPQGSANTLRAKNHKTMESLCSSSNFRRARRMLIFSAAVSVEHTMHDGSDTERKHTRETERV